MLRLRLKIITCMFSEMIYEHYYLLLKLLGNKFGYMDKSYWLWCPVCKEKTRIKLRHDTILVNFPLFCPKFKQETEYKYCTKQKPRRPNKKNRYGEVVFLCLNIKNAFSAKTKNERFSMLILFRFGKPLEKA